MDEPRWINLTVELCLRCERRYPVGTRTCPVCGCELVPKVVRVEMEGSA
jgi:rRNA maturation endonuclease Nob1